MNFYDIKYKSIEELITIIKDIANSGKCNGECSNESPWLRCDVCEANHFLNVLHVEMMDLCLDFQDLVRYRITP